MELLNWGGLITGQNSMFGGFQSNIKRILTEDDLSTMPSMDQIGNLHVWRRTVITEEEIPETPATYTLGESKTQYFIRNEDRGKAIGVNYSDTVKVSYNGEVSLVSPSYAAISTTGQYPSNIVAGKFFQTSGDGSGATPITTSIFYMKPSGVFNNSGSEHSWSVYGTQCQLVTGVAAIPETPAGTRTNYLVSANPDAYTPGTSGNTTIEYMGMLADGARIVTGSYVGTGTYGKSNPNTLEFSEPPSLLIIGGAYNQEYDSYSGRFAIASIDSFIGDPNYGFGLINIVNTNPPITCSAKYYNNILYWYNYDNYDYQLNNSGFVYQYRAFYK